MRSILFFGAFHLYNALMELGVHLAAPVIGRFDRHQRWGVKERITPAPTQGVAPPSGCAWIHAASLGEAKLTEKTLETISGTTPQQKFLLTATTVTGLQRLQQLENPSIIATRLLPVDSLRLMNNLITNFAVNRVWLLETEIWPGMLQLCRRKHVPVGVINARLEERSFERYRSLRFLLKPLFEHLGPVLAQNQRYAERFQAMGVPEAHIHVTGNMKSDIRIKRPSATQREDLRKKMQLAPEDFVVTAGCFHPGETAVVARCLPELRKRLPGVRCIVVPRHLTSVPQLLEELPPETLHLTQTRTERHWDCCVIDKWGILDDMYLIADIAVVGGTFVPVGGHNMWDAARHGIPVLFGTHHQTQKDSCDMLVETGVGFPITTDGQFTDTIVSLSGALKNGFQSSVDRLAATLAAQKKNLEQILQ